MAKEKIIKDTSERWLLTYADLMNLLLIFFIILYSMSQMDQQKFEEFSQSFQEVLGTSTGSTFMPTSGGGNSPINLGANALPASPVIPSRNEQQQMEAVRESVSELIQSGGLGGNVDVRLEERGIVISITAQLLFKPGSADLEPDSKPTIEEIGEVLKKISGNYIKVEGHTDSDPLSKSSKYADNLELSTARANNILRLLVKNAGIDPKKISSAGYGEEMPIAQNDTAENKAKNRRVNIVILRSIYDKSQPETIENPSGSSQDLLP